MQVKDLAVLKNVKKAVLLLLSLTILIVSAYMLIGCGNSDGEKEKYYSEGLRYYLQDDDTYMVTGIGTCTDYDIVIPAFYDGKPVTRIRQNAFNKYITFEDGTGANCDDFIASITIPRTIKVVDPLSFGLTPVIYCEPEGIPEGWWKNDFDRNRTVWDCKNNDKTIMGDSFTTVDNISYVIRDGVAATRRFVGRRDDGEVVVRGKVGKGEACPVTEIKAGSFWCNENIKSVSLPSELIKVSNYAFERCPALEKVTMESGITEIGEAAFVSCTSLTDVTLLDGLKTIGRYAFAQCTSLTKLDLPKSLTTIDDNAFGNCTSLTELVLPDGMESIGMEAFKGCIALSEATVPDSVTEIGNRAFEGCISLKSNNIPSGMEGISPYMFYGCTGLKSLTIGAGVKNIGDEAFYGCSSLESVTIPDSVKNIWDEAFYGCTGLKSLTIGKSVENIGEKVFANCVGLKSVTIPMSVVRMGSSVFNGCVELEVTCAAGANPAYWATNWADGLTKEVIWARPD